jgi:eukaryotic-like serine/threonine-protein kinase
VTGGMPPAHDGESATDTLALRPGQRSAPWTNGLPAPVRRHWWWLVTAAAACIVVLLLVLGIGTSGGNEAPTQAQVPSGVPAKLQQPLQDLHDAVEGQP